MVAPGALWSLHGPDAVGFGTLQSIAKCAVQLLHELHAKSPMSAHYSVLVANLLRELTPHDAFQVAGVPESTLSKARRTYPAGQLGELASAYPTGVHRHRLAAPLLDGIKNWIKEQCTTASGTRREHYEQLLPTFELHNTLKDQYGELLLQIVARARSEKASGTSKPDPATETLLQQFAEHEQRLAFLSWLKTAPASVSAAFGGAKDELGPAQHVLDYLFDTSTPLPAAPSLPVFVQVKDQLPITERHAYWGKFDCKVCADGRNAKSTVSRLENKALGGPLNAADSKLLRKSRATLKKFEFHQRVKVSQRAAFDALRGPQPAGHALCLLDFSSFDVALNISENDTSPFRTLVFVIERPGRERLYIDVLCEDRDTQAGDWFFVRAALIELFFHTDIFAGVEHVTLGSDDQFRSRYMFALYAALQTASGPKIRALYRAAHHGRSLCDAHVGIAARNITAFLKRKQHEREQAQRLSAVELPPVSPLATSAELKAELETIFAGPNHKRDYRCLLLPTVPREPRLKPTSRELPGIMKIHDVSFESDRVALVKQLTSDEEADRWILRTEKPWKLLSAAQSVRVQPLPDVSGPLPASSVSSDAMDTSADGKVKSPAAPSKRKQHTQSEAAGACCVR